MGASIHRLPENLVRKIAAGEVIERPASVVKELVENALDAEAGRVGIDVEEAGRQGIRVADSGLGMSREDVQLCTERTPPARCARPPTCSPSPPWASAERRWPASPPSLD